MNFTSVSVTACKCTLIRVLTSVGVQTNTCLFSGFITEAERVGDELESTTEAP